MRHALPHLRPNGHAPDATRVFVISGICQEPRFRLRCQEQDYCMIYLGASPFGASSEAAEGDPYFIWRRAFDDGDARVAVRVEWEGIFTVLANDDECAEAVYRELLEPGKPDEVQREWSEDAAAAQMLAEILTLE